MQAIDWVGIGLLVLIVIYAGYKIFGSKKPGSGCGCGNGNKCKPKVYDSKKQES